MSLLSYWLAMAIRQAGRAAIVNGLAAGRAGDEADGQ